MGFGSLFIGYFLLFNITYPAYTDLLAALLMLGGLNKLAAVNRQFRFTRIACLLYALLGAYELTAQLGLLFSVTLMPPSFAEPVSVGRNLILLVFTLWMLFGIREVAKEVDLPALVTRCERSLGLPIAVYLLRLLLEIPALSEKAPVTVVGAVGSVVLLAELFTVLHNLRTIAMAYRLICMPEDADMPQKPSRFAFVNRFREQADAAEAEREQMRKERHRKS